MAATISSTSCSTLKKRLLLAEDEFLSALAAGDGAVSSFNDRWERLVDDVDAAIETNGLDTETSALIHAVASRIAILAEASADIFEANDRITSDLVAEIEELVAEMSLEEYGASRSRSIGPPSYPDILYSNARPLPADPEHKSYGKRSRSSSKDSSREAPVKKRRLQAQSFACDSSPRDLSSTSPSPSQTSCRLPSVPAPHPTSERHLNRKRRLSDADVTSPACAKRLYAGPRLHAVSDSFVLRETRSEGASTPPNISQTLVSLVSEPRQSSLDSADVTVPTPGPASIPASSICDPHAGLVATSPASILLTSSSPRPDVSELDAFLATVMYPISPDNPSDDTGSFSPSTLSALFPPIDFLLPTTLEPYTAGQTSSPSNSSLSSTPSSSRASSPSPTFPWSNSESFVRMPLPTMLPLCDALDINLGHPQPNHDAGDAEQILFESMVASISGSKQINWQDLECDTTSLLPPIQADLDEAWGALPASVGLLDDVMPISSSAPAAAQPPFFSWWNEGSFIDPIIDGTCFTQLSAPPSTQDEAIRTVS